MQRLLASLILAAAMFIGIAIPKGSPEPSIAVHLSTQQERQDLVFGDGAHKHWKEFAENNQTLNSP